MSADSPMRPVRRALISVSDKTGLEDFGNFLVAQGVEILSTGGTARQLRDAGLTVTDVSDHTEFPEILDGRVKTLHPMVHGGLLGQRDNPEHQTVMAAHGIAPIDLLIVNLYPFEATVARGAGFEECVENIDIGGPALIRAAAKNHGDVAVVVDTTDYDAVRAEMEANAGATSGELRKRLAATAYARTATYDGAIATWFANQGPDNTASRVAVSGTLKQALRYGENPHLKAAFYDDGSARPGVATAEQVQGKELSYNNINDTDAAFELAAEFDAPTVAIIKHANPCGIATGGALEDIYLRALACDPVSAFGGIIAVNRQLDAAIANRITDLFAEVVIAPDAEPEARKILATKKNLRLLLTGGMPDPTATGLIIRSVAGGFLAQERDAGRIAAEDLRVVTKRHPVAQELDDLIFAFRVCKHVKSNAIVYVRDGATVGIGAGQMSRVDSSRIAAWKAREAAEAAGESASRTKGSVVASDAFFPFADGLLAAAEAGVTAVIQPGGSVRDDEVIEAADEKDVAMVFTGMRHFRH